MKDVKSIINKILPALPVSLAVALENCKEPQKIEEIRMRLGKPFCITADGKTQFLRYESGQSGLCTKADIAAAVKYFCNSSVYAHQAQINRGFLPAPMGGRIGVCGNFSGENLCDFSSINIRLAHEIFGCADRIVHSYSSGGILIAGPPGVGKTTVLRDAVRQLSNSGYKISLIDSRGEISGENSMDTGALTDVFLFGEVHRNAEIALRCFSPNIICFDEISSSEELEVIAQSFNSGVDIISTAHAGTKEDFYNRPVLRSLLHTGAVKTVYLMNGRDLRYAEKFNIKELVK